MTRKNMEEEDVKKDRDRVRRRNEEKNVGEELVIPTADEPRGSLPVKNMTGS